MQFIQASAFERRHICPTCICQSLMKRAESLSPNKIQNFHSVIIHYAFFMYLLYIFLRVSIATKIFLENKKIFSNRELQHGVKKRAILKLSLEGII